MKFSVILLALVACVVATPVLKPPKDTTTVDLIKMFEEADRQFYQLKQDYETQVPNCRELFFKILELEKAPQTPEVVAELERIRELHHQATEKALKTEDRIDYALDVRNGIAKEMGMAAPIVKSEEPVVKSEEPVVKNDEPAQPPTGEPQPPTNAGNSGEPLTPSTNAPAHPKPRSIMTIMKENPGRTALGAAVTLTALASIYALIARRRRYAMNNTVMVNSTVVPSIMSAPINVTGI